MEQRELLGGERALAVLLPLPTASHARLLWEVEPANENNELVRNNSPSPSPLAFATARGPQAIERAPCGDLERRRLQRGAAIVVLLLPLRSLLNSCTVNGETWHAHQVLDEM
jgi:hypothetical protein